MKDGRPRICPDGLAKKASFTIPEAIKEEFWQYCAARYVLPSQMANKAIMLYDGNKPSVEPPVGQSVRVAFKLCPSTLEKLKNTWNKSLFVAHAIASFIQKD